MFALPFQVILFILCVPAAMGARYVVLKQSMYKILKTIFKTVHTYNIMIFEKEYTFCFLKGSETVLFQISDGNQLHISHQISRY